VSELDSDSRQSERFISKVAVALTAALEMAIMRRAWHLIVGVGYLGLSGLFAWIFYVCYWKWRDCIEEAMSSCATPDGDVLIGGGRFWIVPSVLFAIACARRIVRWRNARQLAAAV
jgi:hypothetical protein